MKFAVFDTISVNPWPNTDPDNDGLGPYEALNCRDYIYYVLIFSLLIAFGNKECPIH
jgi:hypothetical protein